jgi:hypothetical protein
MSDFLSVAYAFFVLMKLLALQFLAVSATPVQRITHTTGI